MKLPKITKPNKKQVKHFLVYVFIIVVGNAITAMGSSLFIIPNGFVMGGTTGIGIFVRNLIGEDVAWREWAVSITVYTANIILFLVGAVLLGKKFAAATLAGTLLYPSFVSLFQIVNDVLVKANGGNPLGSSNPFVALFFGALLFGAGIGMVVRVGASTGGTDIPALILHKFFAWPISAVLWVLDFLIILLQFFAHITIDEILCGILIALLSSVVVEMVGPIGRKKMQVKIVSKKYRAIRDMILDDLNRGVTVLFGQTGYLKEKCYVLLTIVSNRELVKLKNKVQEIDPEAFLTVGVISEVRGRGFTSEGIKLPKEAEGKDELEEVALPPQTPPETT